MENLNSLKWKCRRGMKELDILFEYFLENFYLSSADNIKLEFKTLLEEHDNVVFSYVTGKQIPKNEEIKYIINKMKSFSLS